MAKKAVEVAGRSLDAMLADLTGARLSIEAALYAASAHGKVGDPKAILDAIDGELSSLAEAGREVAEHVRREVARLEAERRRAAENERELWKSAEKAVRNANTRAENALAGLVVSELDKAFDPDGCFVYCLWGRDRKVPIYVGKSTNILSRLGAHMNDSTKRILTYRITLLRCANEMQMDATERRLIARYQPELNTAGITARN